MNLLLWLATILFAILQVRTNFTGNPPIGILLDYVIVFPVLSAMLLLGILNTFYWIRRWDWDLENEPTSETVQ
jgi:asparagine N-glycosylation enzyme membrane subunit Stt3